MAMNIFHQVHFKAKEASYTVGEDIIRMKSVDCSIKGSYCSALERELNMLKPGFR